MRAADLHLRSRCALWLTLAVLTMCSLAFASAARAATATVGGAVQGGSLTASAPDVVATPVPSDVALTFAAVDGP